MCLHNWMGIGCVTISLFSENYQSHDDEKHVSILSPFCSVTHLLLSKKLSFLWFGVNLYIDIFEFFL